MVLRARNLFLAWLAYGALQLALLGLPGAATQPGVGNRGAQSQTESQSVSLGKRVLAPELVDRRAPTTPFAPSVHVRLDLPTAFGREALVVVDRQAHAVDPVVTPPARAPPALS
ncbi:MAG TPA: hypothetical protein VM076_18750 [Gemmatimonadaceae bacterium]|nr:hypothetical protein [Gemmatimonadaceae bacterium]